MTSFVSPPQALIRPSATFSLSEGAKGEGESRGVILWFQLSGNRSSRRTPAPDAVLQRYNGWLGVEMKVSPVVVILCLAAPRQCVRWIEQSGRSSQAWPRLPPPGASRLSSPTKRGEDGVAMGCSPVWLGVEIICAGRAELPAGRLHHPSPQSARLFGQAELAERDQALVVFVPQRQAHAAKALHQAQAAHVF